MRVQSRRRMRKGSGAHLEVSKSEDVAFARRGALPGPEFSERLEPESPSFFVQGSSGQRVLVKQHKVGAAS